MNLNITCYFKDEFFQGSVGRRRRAQQESDTFTSHYEVILLYDRHDIVNATRAMTILNNETVIAEILAGDEETLEDVLRTIT
eukprot:5458453-Pleurochrysis_carterae.AAC.1